MRLLILASFALGALAGHDRLDLSSLLVDDDGNGTVSEDTPLPYHDGNALRVPLNETGTAELLEHWLSQAVSGLMAAVASNRLDTVDEETQEELTQCSKNAHDVPAHARCVKKLLKASKESGEAIVKDNVRSLKYKPSKSVTVGDDGEEVEWTGGFGQARVKRSSAVKVVSRSSYALKEDAPETPFAQVARLLTKTVREVKHKKDNETWQETLLKVKRTAEEEKEAKRQRAALKKKLKHMIDNTPDEFADPRRPLAMKKLEMAEEEEEELEESKHKVSEENAEIRIPINLMREAIKLGMSMSGKNVTDFDKKTLKLVSPRFMSVVEDGETDEDTINLLSPSLFSLHSEGKGIEALTSLPAILKNLNNHDQEAWMDFIIEASGVSDSVDKARKDRAEQRRKETLGSRGEPLYFTKENATKILGEEETRKIEVFEALEKTYTEDQRAELDKSGYLFMRPEQIEIVYGKNSPYHDEVTYRRLINITKTLPEKEKHELMEKDIHALAELESFKMRKKDDIVGAPFFFTPLTFQSVALSNKFVVLSPLVFSPITLSPATLGPIVLSPWVFIPLVLSPRVLSPLILDPMIFSPIILSPLALHPLVLSPGIFNPFVLSPLVLSPFILSPQVFTPFILSPLALSPLILNPMSSMTVHSRDARPRTPSCSSSDDSFDGDVNSLYGEDTYHSHTSQTIIISPCVPIHETKCKAVIIDVETLEDGDVPKKKRTVTFSEFPPMHLPAPVYEMNAKDVWRERINKILPRLSLVIFILVFFGFVTFLALQSYNSGTRSGH